jgi:uncharacterized protein
MNLQKFLQEHSVKLLAIRDTPNAIAGGVAIGIFFGFTPLFGLKTVLSIFIAWVFRCNLLAAFIGVTLHDVAFFFLPVILRIEYDVGYWVISSPHQLPTRVHMHLHHLNAEEWFRWDTFVNVGVPLLAGSIVLGLPVSGLSFFLTQGAVLRHHRKRQLTELAALEGPPKVSNSANGKAGKPDDPNPS